MSKSENFRFPVSHLLERKTVYEGRVVDLVVDQVEIAGRKAVREVVRHPGGVVILGVMDDGRIPFVRQHRYPMDRVLLELPAGKIDPDEAPEISASREMEEETGFRPREIQLVSTFYSSPGFCDELLYMYYAPSLIRTAPNRDHDEHLELLLLSLEESLELASKGEILDGKTLTALYWFKCYQSSR